jgi:ABC-type glycerol-3-phosphate transport system substrate-binding protein
MIDFSAIGLEGYDDFMIDLYPLMDADPDFDRSDPMESVLNDFEIDGELYAAPSSFSINGFVGLTALVGEESGWTLDEMLAIEERYAPDAAPLGGLSRAYALEFWLSAIADSFIDWDTGKCAFDSDEFLRILEYIKTIPENSAEYTINDLFGGELAFFPINYMLSYTELQTLDVLFGDNAYTFKGYPTRSGDGGLSRKYYLFPAPGISSTCSDVDGAWSFIKFMYNGYEGLASGYQVSKRSRDKLIRQTREEQTFTELDENGNEVLVPRTPGMGSFLGLPGELEDVLLYPVSDEQAERLDAVADSCDLTVNPDSAVMGIINEELPAFFAGDKSSADTAKIIQSRVQIYVSEQM